MNRVEHFNFGKENSDGKVILAGSWWYREKSFWSIHGGKQQSFRVFEK